VAAIATALLSTGCGLHVADHMCEPSEYPATAVGSYAANICVSKGKEPPAGYVRFPKGKVPQYVDDKWDKYWHHHALDKNGRVIPAVTK
jgi:hypothetical protein